MVRGKTTIATVVRPTYEPSNRDSRGPEFKLTLTSPTHKNMKISIPKSAFQGEDNARVVALVNSDSSGLPSKPRSIDGGVLTGKKELFLVNKMS